MFFGSTRALILRGLMAITFGMLLIVWPSISLTMLIVIFGAFAFVDGVLIFIIGVEMPHGAAARSIALAAGAMAMIVGVVTFLWPGLTELALLVLIAVRAILVGGAELVAAGRIGWDASGAWLLAAIGLLSIAFGGVLLVYPGAGLLAVVWAIGVYAIVVGLLGLARASFLVTARPV